MKNMEQFVSEFLDNNITDVVSLNVVSSPQVNEYTSLSIVMYDG